MAKRVCLEPGCPTLVDVGQGRCDNCSRERDRARGTSSQRGYDSRHQRERAAWKPAVEAGQVTCRRCNEPIAATAPWDLGHPDRDCDKPTAPEHQRCNRATRGR